LIELKKKYPNCTLVYDPHQMALLAQRLRNHFGIRTDEFVQSLTNLSAMTQNLYDLVRYQRLIVYPDQKLRTAITRCFVTENSAGQRIIKNREQTDHVDMSNLVK